jgi:uncharacterized protein
VKLTLRRLRAHAVAHTFEPAATPAAALERLGFVQADPIRAPARAQDLILHQRLAGYRAGDLERHYPALGIEEGYLYAYGFLTRQLWQVRHPPNSKRLTQHEQRVLHAVLERGEVHPDHLEAAFGTRRARNAWGSYSRAAKLALERLHARGLLRVARRANGVRVYAPNAPPGEPRTDAQRFEALLRAVINVLAPVHEQSLRAVMAKLARALGSDTRAVLAQQRAAGVLESGDCDGATYLWPAAQTAQLAGDQERALRLVAPFDPLVWDRRRFEQLWGWAYRFEAYTPVARRVRGYYALPLLWRERVIGWANLARSGPELNVELGFVGRRPGELEFRRQLEAELERMREFLGGPDPE